MTSSATEARQAAENSGQAFAALAEQLQQLTARLTAARTGPPAPAPSAAALSFIDGPEPLVRTPERFDGDPKSCNAFITNCSLLFSLQLRTFASEAAKVAFAITYLTGRARLWGMAEWERQTPACSSFPAFAGELQKVFGHVGGAPISAFTVEELDTLS